MAHATGVEFFAGGTDVMERRRSGVAVQLPARLPVSEDMRAIAWRDDGRAMLGAAVTIDQLAHDPRLGAAYPGLVAAAAGLATPEIRRMATVGGNLTQRSRCWYFRNHAIACLKKGGASCPAREGNHLYGVAFDLGACVAPHPSTLGAALLAYDATVTTSVRANIAVAQVFGDGRDGSHDHQLANGEIIQSIELPLPVAGERAVYHRAISRAHAEWPLAEIVVRLVLTGDIISDVAVALGGVAPVPMRVPDLEAALRGATLVSLRIDDLARLANRGARPLPMTGYKLALIEGLVADALGRLAARAS